MFRRAGAILILVLSAVVSPNVLAVSQGADSAVTAHPTIRVDEGASRVYVNRKPARVELAVVSEATGPISARLALQVLDPRDVVRASTETPVTLEQGRNVLSAEIDLSSYTDTALHCEGLFDARLRYQIIPVDLRAPQVRSVSDQIALQRISPDLFLVQVVAPPLHGMTEKYVAYINTYHPDTGKPKSGAEINAVFEADAHSDGEAADQILKASEGKLKASARTDENGQAVLEFKIPATWIGREADLRVVARDGEFKVDVEETVEPGNGAWTVISTDKPLYQPGQKMHIRLLVIQGPGRRFSPNAKIKLKILSPEDEVLHAVELRTSRFGVASTDWTFPENARLGDYEIEATLPELDPDDNWNSFYSRQSVRVTRYDLPTFTVEAKPDRSFYLPGEKATLKIQARYLFGKPVPKSKVRVVQEASREWNYSEQKWEVDEAESYEGETDEAGTASIAVDLAIAFKELNEHTYSDYENWTYAVYVTDSSTGRTEQRRVGLRVSKEPLHLRVAQRYDPYDVPWDFYVTAFYPDGAPASCPVDVQLFGDERDTEPVAETSVRTNRFGLAKVAGLRASQKGRSGYFTVRLTAPGPNGLPVRKDDRMSVSGDHFIGVSTPANIQKPGEPLQVQIESDLPDTDLNVSVWADRQVIQMGRTRLISGKAEISFPYRDSMRRAVTITAFSFQYSQEMRYGSGPIGSKVVIYPGEPDTHLEIRTDHPQYRPGDQAHAEFQIRQRDGAPESDFLLGVLTADRAVEERARTIQEFEMPGYHFNGLAIPDYDYQSFSGITLEQLFVLKPEQIDADYDLIAGLLTSSNVWLDCLGETSLSSASDAHSEFFKKQFDPIGKALDDAYHRLRVYPRSAADLRAQMEVAGINIRDLADPWGNPYHVTFAAVGLQEGLEVTSDGPDEKPETADDIPVFVRRWYYFQKYGEMIDRAQKEYHERTGRFIRDAPTLKAELRRHGVAFDSLRDPWGNPYKPEFSVDHGDFTIAVRTANQESIWRSRISYWVETEKKIRIALIDWQARTGRYPRSPEELFQALKQGGIKPTAVVDGWDNRVKPILRTEWRYTDKYVTRSVASFGEQPRLREDVVPTNQELARWLFVSRGPDGREGTRDDFTLGSFADVISEKTVEQQTASGAREPIKNTSRSETKVSKVATALVSDSTGAISGAIIDSSHAVIPDANIKVIDEKTGRLFHTVSDDNGIYAVSELPAGLYTVRAYLSGFREVEINAVPVRTGAVTRLDFELKVGTVSEEITVESTVVSLQTECASISEDRRTGAFPSVKRPAFTPRVRQYFPETLLWYPELEVGKDGRAELTFQLPDSLTTWKTSVIATSLNGDSAYQEIEFETFQPFFLEPDPPQFLTAGDRIELPVVVRNYLDTAQDVALEIEPGEGLEVEGASHLDVKAPAQESVPVYFPIRAAKATPKVQPKVTGIAGETGDAVVKSLEIRPDGREESLAEGRLLGDSSAWTFNIPTGAIAGTPRGELRIYTDIGAHLVDAMAGIQANPNGCPEQITSSTFPSVLLLQYERAGGRVSPGLKQRALRDVELSCQKLNAFALQGGGFGYWRDSEPNLALTAYALRFLTAARDFVSVDEETLKGAAQALLAGQAGDGRWPSYWYWPEKQEDVRQSVSLTAYIARSLAELKDVPGVFSPVVLPGQAEARTVHMGLERAFAYLESRWDRTSDPYVIALYAQAALRLGKNKEAEQSVRRLLELVKREGPATYWNLETNSIFYGWGRAGRIETTALAVQALTLARQKGLPAGADSEELRRPLDGAAQFLLKNKDRCGIWWSGQATVLALEALVGIMPSRPADEEQGGQLEVRLNGRLIEASEPESDASGGPIRYDLSARLRSGSNKLEIRRRNGAPGLALLTSSWYEPWSAPRAVATEVNSNTRLGLDVSFDRVKAARGESIECKAKIERIGFSGYGMLLAEIGLPPGVDVDRASLDAARDQAGWALASYEVLPDRIVMYLWPRAGGIDFTFKFKPRIGMVAKSTRSVLYDYYNPDLRAVLPPQLFEVRGK